MRYRYLIFSTLLTILFVISFTTSSFALVFIKNTISSGYYRDINKDSHITTFFNLHHEYLGSSRIESLIDIDINNNFILDEWKVIPNQINITIPLTNNINNVTNNTRVIIGRQLLTESFNITILDGFLLPYYINRSWAIISYGGGTHVTEERKLSFDDSIYGTNALFRSERLTLKIGPQVKSSNTNKDGVETDHSEYYYLISTASLNFYDLPLTPLLFSKMEFNFDNSTIAQESYELNLSWKNITWGTSYTSRYPDPIFKKKQSYLYNLIAIEKEKAISTFASISLLDDTASIFCSAEQISFESRALKEEFGYRLTLSSDFDISLSTITQTILYIKSFGGEMYNFSLKFNHPFNDMTNIVIEGDISTYKKINGIEATAYHVRTGLDFNFTSQIKASILSELERNHLFDIDARLVGYARFYY